MRSLAKAIQTTRMLRVAGHSGGRLREGAGSPPSMCLAGGRSTLLIPSCTWVAGTVWLAWLCCHAATLRDRDRRVVPWPVMATVGDRQARRSWDGWTGPLRFRTLRAALRHHIDRQVGLAQRGDEVLWDDVPALGFDAVDPVVLRTIPQSGDWGLVHGCASPSPAGGCDGDRAWRSRRRYSSNRPRSS